jgi:glycine dehydrogenase
MTRISLSELEARDAFIARHIGPSAAEQAKMLETVGYASREALIDAVVPANIRRKEVLPLGMFTEAKSEQAALAQLKAIASKIKF